MQLLHLDSSATGAHSVTRALSAAIVSRWREAVPGLSVVRRDLDAVPLPHLDGATLAGQDAASAAIGRTVLDEFKAADVIVVGAPMYNFSVPSTLKAWIDRIAVAGETFRYTADGPQGLMGGKTVVVASGRGGRYAGSPVDFQEPYLRAVFGWLGITDVHIVRAEGVALSPQDREAALQAARAQVAALPAPLPRAA